MPRFTLKKTEIGSTTTSIKIEHRKLTSDIYNEITALSILLGGYNDLGRKIPIEVYETIKDKFEDVLSDMKTEYAKYNN